jgi:hypothetical protein
VTAGQRLAVVLRASAAEDTTPYDWFVGPPGDDFAGGSSFCRGAGTSACASGWADIGGDMQMRVVVELPEPAVGATSAVAIAGVAALACYARASKKST